MKIMLRMILIALLVGSIVSITAISLFKGFDIEGVMIGLTSLILLFGISSFFFNEYKKQIVNS